MFVGAPVARYSFLLVAPAVLAFGLHQLSRSAEPGIAVAPGQAVLTARISIGVSFAAIDAYMKFVSSRSCLPFLDHRTSLALIVLALLQVAPFTIRCERLNIDLSWSESSWKSSSSPR